VLRTSQQYFTKAEFSAWKWWESRAESRRLWHPRIPNWTKQYSVL